MKQSIDFDKVYDSNNYGKYKILREIEPKVYQCGTKVRMVEVIFLDTGTIVKTKLSTAINSHAIKDNYYPKVHNVGYIGNTHMIDIKLYKAWNDMISRCYNPKHKSYNTYGGAGVRVCDRWLCYENFVNDIVELDGYYEYINYPGYQLDKDFLQKGVPLSKKVYSKSTCCFVSKEDNISECIRRTYPDKLIGVKQISDNRFVARIHSNGNELYLGTFTSPEYAAEIFDYYAKIYGHKIINNLNIDIGLALRNKIGCKDNQICKNVMCKIVDKS